MKYNSD